ncbi:MAG: hypothetical protein R3330_15455, partial [Saprospiraceae bacterium]|nr:hypothetical protein [Saprospiraceae bacterium]
EKAQQRNQELIEAAWPDEDDRQAYFQSIDKYYTGKHSDEIYRTRGGAKFVSEESEEPVVIYMQKSQTTWPDDGDDEEIAALDNEYSQAVIHKNDLVLGYYPMRHGWGANSDEYVDVFVYKSLADLEKAGEKTGELVQAHWSDETARGKFFDRYNAYFTGWHADYLYMTVPELDK